MPLIRNPLMWRYYELLSFLPAGEIEQLRHWVAGGGNPRDAKIQLAAELVGRFHGESAAEQAREEFLRRFSNKQLPANLEALSVHASDGRLGIAHLRREAGLVPSPSEALRMIRQGAVRIDGERVADGKREIQAGASHLFQVGKRRVARITVLG